MLTLLGRRTPARPYGLVFLRRPRTQIPKSRAGRVKRLKVLATRPGFDPRNPPDTSRMLSGRSSVERIICTSCHFINLACLRARSWANHDSRTAATTTSVPHE